MRVGQQVVLTALRHNGDTEDPWASNTDRGGWIDQIQRAWGLHGVPWCGCAWDAWYREAGVTDNGIGSPSTGAMCQHAQNGGWLWKGGPVPAGAAWLRCGIHVELVVGDRGNGVLDCIGGNVNQAVRQTVRRISDATIIAVPPAILEGDPEPVHVYGFDDLNLRPKRYGGWATKEQRKAVIQSLSPAKRKQVHTINIGGPSPFAFVIYPTDNTRWHFGPWESKDRRDALMREYQHSHPHHRLRPWSILVNDLGGHGGMTTGETLT